MTFLLTHTGTGTHQVFTLKRLSDCRRMPGRMIWWWCVASGGSEADLTGHSPPVALAVSPPGCCPDILTENKPTTRNNRCQFSCLYICVGRDTEQTRKTRRYTGNVLNLNTNYQLQPQRLLPSYHTCFCWFIKIWRDYNVSLNILWILFSVEEFFAELWSRVVGLVNVGA